MNGRDKGDFVFEITEHIGIIRSYNNGWTKELNMVAWNDAKPKYDIRDWNPDHQQMARGITLHVPEMKAVLDLLKGRPDLAAASAPAGGGDDAAAGQNMPAPAAQIAPAQVSPTF